MFGSPPSGAGLNQKANGRLALLASVKQKRLGHLFASLFAASSSAKTLPPLLDLREEREEEEEEEEAGEEARTFLSDIQFALRERQARLFRPFGCRAIICQQPNED